MKLKDTYITHDSDGEQILLDTSSSFAGLIRSNKTAAFIVECLKYDTTQEKIVEAMFEKYDAPKDVLAKDVSDVIEKLRKVGALEEEWILNISLPLRRNWQGSENLSIPM